MTRGLGPGLVSLVPYLGDALGVVVILNNLIISASCCYNSAIIFIFKSHVLLKAAAVGYHLVLIVQTSKNFRSEMNSFEIGSNQNRRLTANEMKNDDYFFDQKSPASIISQM